MKVVGLVLGILLITSFAFAEPNIFYLKTPKVWYHEIGKNNEGDQYYYVPEATLGVRDRGDISWTTVYHNTSFYILKVVTESLQAKKLVEDNLLKHNSIKIADDFKAMKENLASIEPTIDIKRLINVKIRGY